jgi:5-bromo-4-chloroindolyl phosphate hydrolysis protein
MGEKEEKSDKGEDWTRPSVSKLEADLAYFDARICLLGEKATSSYQNAEIKAYRALETSLNETLERLRRRRKQKRREKKEPEAEPFSESIDVVEVVEETFTLVDKEPPDSSGFS